MRLAAVVLAVLLPVAAVRATPPLGGDDTGFVPPDADARSCAGKVAKNAARLGTCLSKCHVRAVSDAFGGAPFQDDLCEQQCIVAYATKAVRIVTRATCPVCIDHELLGTRIRDVFEDVETTVYCDGTFPLAGPGDGDDGGVLPTSADTLACENRIARGAGRLARCLLGCHQKLGDTAFAGQPFDEEACEDRCQLTFVNLSVVGVCPPCVFQLPTIAGSVRSPLDADNGIIYCAGSPSPAFLEDPDCAGRAPVLSPAV